MKLTRAVTLFLVSTLLHAACTPPAEKTEINDEQTTDETPDEVKVQQALYDDIMLVHDEMMPKMEDLMRIRGEVQEIKDSLKAAGIDEDIDVLVSTIQMVENADESMMNWMRNFEPVSSEESHENIMAYYTDQKNKMDSVKLIMEEAIGKGQAILSDY